MKLSTAISETFKSHQDSIITVMKYLLLILMLLSAASQIFVLIFFPNTMSVETQMYTFGPVYGTIIISYLLLELSKIRMAIHTFLLGSVLTQLLLLVFVTGHTNYIYVSYTNVVLIAGLMLGPINGFLYTILIVFCISLYFVLVQFKYVDPFLIEVIQNHPELGLMATLCCFVFTGVTVSLFVLKQSQLYQNSLKERERTTSTLKTLENLQQINESRAKQGQMIGWLGQQLIKMEYAQQFIERSTPKIRQLLDLDLLLILFSDTTLPATIIRSEKSSDSTSVNTTNSLNIHLPIEPNVDDLSWLPDNITLPAERSIHFETIVDSNGSIGAMIAVAKNIPLEEETFLGTVANIFSSALKREQTENQVRHLQKMEAINLLAGGIAHDFNNLLMSIMGNTDITLSHVNNREKHIFCQDLKELLQQINWASERGSSLTRKLLSFTKKEVSSPEVVDVNEILADIQPIFEQVFKRQSVLSIEYSPKPAYIHIDRKDFESALLNLIINARDAIGQTGTVNISITTEPSSIPTTQIVISDTGSGIPETILSSIFEPFITTKPNGTGLGLTMVRSMVERGQGTINVNSSTTGTEFILSFPTSGSKSNTIERTQPEMSSKVILVVDDEYLVLKTISRMLRMHNFEVLQANDVPSAKEVLKTHDVDLVLSDLNMAGESGIDLQKFCLQEYPNIRFLLMTGFLSQAHSFDLPIIEKPLNIQTLLTFVHQGLAKTTEEMPN